MDVDYLFTILKTKHEPELISPDKELYNKEVHACHQVIASAVFKLIGSLALKATNYLFG
jgi:hypothetical protein